MFINVNLFNKFGTFNSRGGSTAVRTFTCRNEVLKLFQTYHRSQVSEINQVDRDRSSTLQLNILRFHLRTRQTSELNASLGLTVIENHSPEFSHGNLLYIKYLWSQAVLLRLSRHAGSRRIWILCELLSTDDQSKQLKNIRSRFLPFGKRSQRTLSDWPETGCTEGQGWSEQVPGLLQIGSTADRQWGVAAHPTRAHLQPAGTHSSQVTFNSRCLPERWQEKLFLHVTTANTAVFNTI